MEEIVIGTLLFLYGISMGSFYNVIIYRLPLEIGIVRGRSFCPDCKHNLVALDLVPIFSFVFLKGKCRYCDKKISMRYPLVELLVGLLFLLAYLKYGFTLNMLYHIVFWSMLVIVGLIDLDTMYIFDSVLIFFGVVQIALLLANKVDLMDSFIGAAIGAGIYFLIYLISRIVYKKEAFGTGDIILMALIGLFVGKEYAILASILPFYFAFIALIIMVIKKSVIENRQEMSFGPFMCLSAWLISMYGEGIQGFILNILG